MTSNPVAERPNEIGTIPIYFSMVVWGDQFVSFFLKFCLPSLLSSGNIPAIKHRHGSKFVLHTSSLDMPRIEASAVFQALREMIGVDVLYMDDRPGDPHTILSACHRETMHLADEAAVPAVFLSPDTLWSSDTVHAIDHHLTRGKRVILLWSMRLLKETAEPEIEKFYENRQAGVITASARDLNDFALRFLHPTIEEYFLTGRGNKLAPSVMLWEVPNGDVLAHAFHQHPLLVYPRNRFAEFGQTIDGDLVLAACPDTREHYVVQDSDEITAIELSNRAHFQGGMFHKGDFKSVAKWNTYFSTNVHWKQVSYPVRMHRFPIQPRDWEKVERDARHIVDKMVRFRTFRMPFLFFRSHFHNYISARLGIPLSEVPEWVFRKKHKYRYGIKERHFRIKHRLLWGTREIVFRSGQFLHRSRLDAVAISRRRIVRVRDKSRRVARYAIDKANRLRSLKRLW